MIIGSKVFHKKHCHDSFDWAASNIDVAPNGSVFVCDFIDKAKGRQDRKWLCTPGQLLMTFLFKPDSFDISSDNLAFKLNELMMLFSVGIVRALNVQDLGLKWPNDFVFNGRKLGGLLGKTVWRGSDLEAVMVGIGLNINNSFSSDSELFDLATSLKIILGFDSNIDIVFQNILKECNDLYLSWLKNKDCIFNQWRSCQDCLGKNIVVHNDANQKVFGFVKDFYSNGDMLLVDDHNQTHRLSFNQVVDIEVMD